MQRRTRTLLVTAATAALILVAAPAFAHVTMEAENTRPQATSTYTISVPNEDDTADTIKIEVELPEGLEVTDFQPGEGWTMAVEDGVLVIDGGELGPGDRRDFRFTGVNPGGPGELVFPAIQTYSDGEEVRWVGEEDSDRPAARVTISGKPVTPAAEQTEPAAGSEPPATEPVEVATQTSEAPITEPADVLSESATDQALDVTDEAPVGAEPGGVSPLAVVAVIAVILALVLGGMLYGRSRRQG